ncbi:MAG: hypothetical protein IPO79_11355 [Flavobacteriales bacterium]|nr:hypothetical protein [Flavobacteriales bacterium]
MVFIAYAILKNIELTLQQRGAALSLKRACELAVNMYQVHYNTPDSGLKRSMILAPSDEQRRLLDALA